METHVKILRELKDRFLTNKYIYRIKTTAKAGQIGPAFFIVFHYIFNLFQCLLPALNLEKLMP